MCTVKHLMVMTIIVAILSGCKSTHSIVKSTSIAKNSAPQQGILYRLPKENIEIKLVRQFATKEKLTAQLSKIQGQIAAKQKAFDEIETNQIPALSSALKQPKLSDTARARFELEIELARLQQTIVKNQQNELQKQLFATQDLLKQLAEQPNGKKSVVDTFTFSTKVTVDSSHMWLAQIEHDGTTSNELDIKTTAAGLLSGGTVSSKGEIDEIVVAAAQAIGAVAGAPGFATSKSAFNAFNEQTDEAPCKIEEKTYHFVLDPNADDPIITLNAALAAEKLCYVVHSVSLSQAKPAKTNLTGTHQGLMYRRKMQIDLSVYRNVLPGSSVTLGEPIKSYYAEISDPHYVGMISMDKGYFADNKYEFEFKDGYLTRYAVTQPSEIVGALSMVPRALKALIEIPAEIIQLKIDYSSKEAAYEQAKAEALKSRLKLEHYQADEDAALAAALEESSGSEE